MLERINYRGWQNSYRIFNHTVELVVLADVGPRIISYGFRNGENVLYEVPEHAGVTGGHEFRLYGGHRLWRWPELASTYFPDNFPVTVSQDGNSVRFTAPLENEAPGNRLQKQLSIELEDRGSRVTVEHCITNRNDHAIELAPWTPTMMKPGGRAILPLPPRAAMDQDHFQSVGPLTLWSFTDFADPRWMLGTEYIQLEQQAKPAGRFQEQMTGIYNPAGWGAYFLDGTLFVKHAPARPDAAYPDFGCNFEVFTNKEFLELETLGPKVHLEAGGSTSHRESWTLFRNVPGGSDDSWIHREVAPLSRAT